MNRACVVALAAGLAVSVAQANDINWAAPVDGFWNTAANWSPATVPMGAADRAILGLSGPYTVNLNVSPSIDGLSITNPEAVLAINANTQINGTLSPGLSVGTMSAVRPVTLGSTSTMLCEFNDSGQSDKFTSTSTVELSGTLQISFIEGYTASSPQAFEIITTGANGRIGRFDQVTGGTPPSPLVTRVLYESNRVRVGFVCPGDANLDGSTDLGDLNAVLANFGTNASLGDVTGDGAVNLADLNLVLATFGTNCVD